jgi:segregation and condensation protein B
MERDEKRRIIEALVLASPEPISAARLAAIVPECTPGDAKDLVNELNTDYQQQDRSFEVWEVAGGYQLRTRAEFSGYLQQLHKQRALRLSRAALDTLSIISYRQPATRAEIDEIRGVDSGAVLKGLLDRQLVRIAGQREVPGRPMLYATTRRFLEVFGLESLKHLPSLRELNDLADEKVAASPPSEALEASVEGADPAVGPLSDAESAVEGETAALVPAEVSQADGGRADSGDRGPSATGDEGRSGTAEAAYDDPDRASS